MIAMALVVPGSAAHAAAAEKPAPAAGTALKLPPAAPSLFDRLDPGVTIAPPRIRIALRGDEGQVKIGSSGGHRFRILDGRNGAPVWPDRRAGTVLVVPEGGRPSGNTRLYRIQVGAYRDEASAKTQAGLFASRYGAPAEALWDPARFVWRVRLGRADSPAELNDLLNQLRASGLAESWIASEPKPSANGAAGTLLLVDEAWQTGRTGTDRLVFVPDGDARLTLDGRPYRGLIEVIRTAAGAVLAINELNLEDYLRGVVPEELGPSAFPEIEAIAAQTVAARTYAVANRGQFAAEGFDLCDTPKCQVYGGAASEHPLSNRAIEETRGQVLAFDGAPINAMFTSTCGGHTEDVETVFPELAAPYLRGVPCRAPEPVAQARLVTIKGRALDGSAAREVDGEPDALSLARLVAHGIAPRAAYGTAWRQAPLDSDEAGGWLAALARAAGKPLPPPFDGRPTRLALWLWADTVLGPPTGASGLVLPGDEDLVLQVDDREAIPAGDRLAIAGLLTRGIIRATRDGKLHPGDVPSRGEVLAWLARAADLFDAFPEREGTLVESDPADRDAVRLREKSLVTPWTLAREGVDLLDEAGAGWHRVDRLELLPGDRLVYVTDAAGRIVVLGLRERKGSADDRTSPRFRWVVARTREQLEARLAEFAPVGTLQDIVVTRRGRSGRVASVEVRGSSGRAVIDGFRLTRAIDLPETQFTMEMLRDPDGSLRRVLFNGRGWGHGVGLCQYGAYGMALRGVSAADILTHYYTGVTLVTLPAAP